MASPETSNLHVVPQPDPSDSGEVVRCLLQARDYWQQGQHREAERAIQRAAEAAEQDGNDLRAIALIRIAADLRSKLPNGSADSTDDASGDAALDVDLETDSAAAAAASTEAAQRSVEVEVQAPAAVPVVAPLADSAPESKPPRVTVTSPRTSQPPASVKGLNGTNGHAHHAPTSEPAPARVSVVPSKPTPSVAPRTLPTASAPPPDKAGASSLSTSLSDLIQSGLAERVNVKRSATDPGVLLVRPVSDKQPRGTRQAVLIYLDPETE